MEYQKNRAVTRVKTSRSPKLQARRRAWTPERRARQAAAIRGWRPWTRSTGPRTATGKAASARNAAKPRSTALRAINAAVALQRRMMRVLGGAEKLGLLATEEQEHAFFARLQQTDLAIDRVTAVLYHALSLLERL